MPTLRALFFSCVAGGLAAASQARDPSPSEVKRYNGAALGAFAVEYEKADHTPNGNKIKAFGEYTIGDIDGELAHLRSQNINKIKTYAHVIWSPIATYNVGLQQYIDRFNAINEHRDSAAGRAALSDLNNPFAPWSGIPSGTKFIIPIAAAEGMDVFATANVSKGMLESSPAGQPPTVEIKYREGGVLKTVQVNTTGYSSAHWEVELALASIANDRMRFKEPQNANQGYRIELLHGSNRDHVKALIIGNEVLTTGGMSPSQVAEMVDFAKQRRAHYGLNDLPVTTSTNSLGSWQTLAPDVLSKIEEYILVNTYGFEFTSINATNQASPANLPQDNPAKAVGDNVLQNISDFEDWLAGTSQPHLNVVIGEHGYPSATAAPDPHDLFSNTNAAAYLCGSQSPAYEGVLNALAKKKILCFFFEIYDEPWKDTTFPADGTERNFGVATVSQEERRFAATADAFKPWEFPQTYAIKEHYCSPLIPHSSKDSDQDGLADDFEAMVINADPGDAFSEYEHVAPDGDFDGDGLLEADEQAAMTNPASDDSDGDLFTDFDEVQFGSDPNSPASLPVTEELMTALEYQFSTLPGYAYQVQYSGDLETWEDLGEPVEGDGATHSVLISFEGRNKSAEHYRVAISVMPQD